MDLPTRKPGPKSPLSEEQKNQLVRQVKEGKLTNAEIAAGIRDESGNQLVQTGSVSTIAKRLALAGYPKDGQE